MKTYIEVKQLSKSYRKTPVLKNIDLQLEGSKIIGLVGPNGAGKSTFLKILAGLLRDYEGEAKIKGEEVGLSTKSKVAFLPDSQFIDRSWTGLDAAVFYNDLYEDFSMEKAEELFHKMNVDFKIPFAYLSKGMRDKFQLALTLAREEDVYLFDEPLGGVDPASLDFILESILESYREDALFVIATHLIRDVENILDEVVFLRDGEIYMHENCDVLRERSGKTIDDLFREVYR